MKNGQPRFLLIFFTLLFLSCNKMTPAGFWKSYKSNFLIKNISDQGPWGGHRAMYWKGDKPNTFNSKDVMDFAIKNSWKLIDSMEFEPGEMKDWYDGNKPFFPVSDSGFDKSAEDLSNAESFPRWITTKLKVYTFKTGWTTVYPGTDKSFEENGFVVIDSSGSEMSVYHLWGD